MLPGKKTYVVAGVMILYAISGLILGHVEANEAWRLILEAVGLGALRAGITKSGPGK